MTPRVSVVLPVRDRAGVLERAMRSVLDQSYRPLELIVVDDGSADASAEVAERVARQDRRVRVIREPARGAAAARNVGLRLARGELLAFQDSDDEWLPGRLERHVRAVDADPPAVGVVYGPMIRVEAGRERPFRCAAFAPEDAHVLERALSLGIIGIGLQALLVRRAAAERAGAFDEALPRWIDYEWLVRVARHARFHYLPEPTARYHATSGAIGTSLEKWLVAQRRFVEVHAEELHARPAALARHYRVWMRNALRASRPHEAREVFGLLRGLGAARPRDWAVLAAGPVVPVLAPMGSRVAQRWRMARAGGW
ncbi:MAG: glycosyltransferase [Halobacteriales archaeon]|nr:glycosyltransferase [Halobacteriales archaeon]